MSREEKIQEKTSEFETGRLLYKLQGLNKEPSMDEFQRYAKDFIKPLDELFKKIRNAQEQDLKDTIYFINIYFLHNTFQKGRLELLAEAYDEKGIFDKEPVSVQYSPQEMSEASQKDWNEYVKFMNSSIIQIKYHELHPYFIMLADAYMKMIREIYSSFALIIVNLESFRNMKISDNIMIGFGEYGCSCTAIYGETNKSDDEDMVTDEVLFN